MRKIQDKILLKETSKIYTILCFLSTFICDSIFAVIYFSDEHQELLMLDKNYENNIINIFRIFNITLFSILILGLFVIYLIYYFEDCTED